MKTYIYHPLILLVIILVTVSCENELPFNIKDNPPKLVMNAFINADSLTNVLFLNLTGKDYANHIENATVEVQGGYFLFQCSSSQYSNIGFNKLFIQSTRLKNNKAGKLL